MSFSGVRFDFQTAGEFVLAENADFQVQARIEPPGGAQNPIGSVSFIDAVAMRMGTDRITVDFSRAQPLWINGVPVSLLPGQSLRRADGTILATSSGFTLTWTTGERVQANSGLVLVTVPDSRAAGTMGVLGPDNGIPADAFTLPNGTVLSQPLSFSDLYTTFADAWRVTQATSLFDYGDGQSTATFTNLNVPAASVSLADLPNALIAQAQAALGKTQFANSAEQQNALLDYILSGGNLAEAVVNSNPALAGTTTQTPVGGPPPTFFGVSPAKTVTDVGAKATTATFDAFRTGPDTNLVVLDWTVVDPNEPDTVGAADYSGGVLPSGQVTLQAGSTLTSFTVPTPAGLTLPTETLEVEILNTSTPAVAFTNQTATEKLQSTVPVKGVEAAPSIYLASGRGTLTGSGTHYTLDFGTVGAAGISATTLGVLNGAVSFGDTLAGSFTASGSGISFGGTAAFSGVAPDGASLFTAVPGTTVGTFAETLVLHPTETNSSGFSGSLPNITITATATVVPATAIPATLPGTVSVTGRAGGVMVPDVTLGNQAVVGGDNLGVVLTDTGGDLLIPQPSPIAPGGTTSVAFSDTVTQPGPFSDTIDVGFTSLPPGKTTGTALAGATLTVDGTTWLAAQPLLQTPTIDFGTVHEGATAPVGTIDLANTLAAGAFDDDLVASFGAFSGPFGGSGTADIAATASGALQAVMSTSTGGVFTGTANIDLVSHDTALSDITIGTLQAVLKGTVIADAAPAFVTVGGTGSIVAIGPNQFTLDLGTAVVGPTPISSTFRIVNDTEASGDSLSGTLLSPDNQVSGSVGTLTPGAASAAFSTSFSRAAPGAIHETVTLAAIDSVVGQLAPTVLTITGAIIPRTLVWTGAKDTNFGEAANWSDVSDDANPSATPPGQTDSVFLISGGGTVGGVDSVDALAFGGAAQWAMASGASLTAEAGITIGAGDIGSLSVGAGAGIASLGTEDVISGADGANVAVQGSGSNWNSAGELVLGGSGIGALTIGNLGTLLSGSGSAAGPHGIDIGQSEGADGTATVSGANALLNNTGTFIVGDAGVGAVTVQSGATVLTTPGSLAGVAGLLIANTPDASGSAVDVTGAGSNWQVTGSLIVGAAGAGSLSLSQGGSVAATSLDEASVSGGSGQIGIVGSGSDLTVTGTADIADQSVATMSILNGGSFQAGYLNIGMGAATGAITVGGAATDFHITNDMTVGHNGIYSIGNAVTVFIDGNFNEIGAVNLGDASLIDPSTATNSAPHGAGGGSGLTASTSITNNSTYFVGDQFNGGYTLTTALITGTGVLEADPAQSAGAEPDLVLNAASIASTQALAFGGQPAAITLGSDNGKVAIAGLAATISSFVAGDTLVVTTTAAAGFQLNGSVVSVVDTVGGATEGTLAFANASLASAAFNTSGALVDQMPCFAAGTRIETVDGPVAVEALRVGDRVVTADGTIEPIVWLGQRTVDCARHPKPETVWPVRVAAGAFGPGTPARDLYLSPDHAVFTGGVLVPVKLLVNGRGIVQVARRKVTYFHVELPRHVVILAEGLTVESYLDVGDRVNFRQAGDVVRLHPDFAARLTPDAAMIWETRAAAPLVLAGAELAAARRAVMAGNADAGPDARIGWRRAARRA